MKSYLFVNNYGVLMEAYSFAGDIVDKWPVDGVEELYGCLQFFEDFNQFFDTLD